MILLVEAWRDADGSPLSYTGTQTVHELGGIGDPNQGYYEGLPGKLYAKLLEDPNGNGPVMFTEAAAITFDNRIAALDGTTGLATGWDPGANFTVLALGVSGDRVYAGGDFTSIGGQPRNRLAALDTATGLATAWDPNPSSSVFALAASGDRVYVGGAFTTIGGLQSGTLRKDANLIDITSADDETGGEIWRNYFSGVKDFEVSGSGISRSWAPRTTAMPPTSRREHWTSLSPGCRRAMRSRSSTIPVSTTPPSTSSSSVAPRRLWA